MSPLLSIAKTSFAVSILPRHANLKHVWISVKLCTSKRIRTDQSTTMTL